MTVMPVIVAPDQRLKAKCQPVENVDSDISRLMDNMLESMYAANGIGLAAPQVGISKRIIVVDVAKKGETPSPILIADPKIIQKSEEIALNEEGCLSFPDYYADISRPVEVTIQYLDNHNEPREINADGLLARCLQHEMDHLDGVLFVDYLSYLKRNIILRKLTKSKKMEK